jgi:hypothetical protein
VPALGIVPDGVVGTKTNPVRNRPVLSHLLSQLLLNHKRLVRRHLEVVRFAAAQRGKKYEEEATNLFKKLKR